MRAAFVKAPWQFEVRDVGVPDVKPGWARVRVDACGVCGTDVHVATHTDHPLTQFPATQWQGFGHEVAGTVDAVASDVDFLSEGDTVVVQSGSFCGHCRHCAEGRVDLCTSDPTFWVNPTMGFAEYMTVPARACVPYEGLTPEVASLAEPFGVALDMTYTASITLGDDVMVLGLGPIGLMSIPIAKRLGARTVYAVNRSGGARAAAAAALGADVVHIGNLNDLEFARSGVDRALSSVAPVAMNDIFPRMNHGGIISYIGIAFGDEERISIPANDFHFKKLQLRASNAVPALYFPTAVDMLGRIDASRLVTDTFGLDDIEEAMHRVRDARGDIIKAVITPHRRAGETGL